MGPAIVSSISRASRQRAPRRKLSVSSWESAIFLFKDLLRHPDTRRSAAELEQRSPAQSLLAKPSATYVPRSLRCPVTGQAPPRDQRGAVDYPKSLAASSGSLTTLALTRERASSRS